MQRVCLLYGQSIGAEVGIELYRQLLDNGVTVDHCLFDGAPCISLREPFARHCHKSFIIYTIHPR